MWHFRPFTIFGGILIRLVGYLHNFCRSIARDALNLRNVRSRVYAIGPGKSYSIVLSDL